MVERVYCHGKLTKAQLAAKLDQGLVLTDLVRRGYSGGDVAYFRDGSTAEIEECRRRMAGAQPGAQSSPPTKTAPEGAATN